MEPLAQVTVVLVEPMYGGNLGSIARALANFGLGRLTLVNPARGIFDHPLLDPMARTAAPLAREARVVETLAEALADVDLALGFTARVGRRRRDTLDLRPALERVVTELPRAHVAGVFGREDSGLTSTELELCQWVVRIATHPDLPSLNLAQAVGLFAYEVSTARRALLPAEGPGRKVAGVAEMEGFYGQLEDLLCAVGFFEEATSARMMSELRRIFSRRLPEPRDVRILRGALSKIQGALPRRP